MHRKKLVSMHRKKLVDQAVYCVENLSIIRITCGEKDKGVHRTQDVESDGFLLLQRLNRLCVYVDFEWFLPKQIL
jgi:hypothetical protein